MSSPRRALRAGALRSRRRAVVRRRACAARAAADADVVADVIVAAPRGPVVDRSISATRFGSSRSRPSVPVNRCRAPGPPQTLAADAIILLFLFKNNSLLRHNSIKIHINALIRFNL